jgi:hypothetical protein
MIATSALPYYDLGPGHPRDEVLANAIIYAMVGAFLLSLLWLAVLFVRAVREERAKLPTPDPDPIRRRTPAPRA